MDPELVYYPVFAGTAGVRRSSSFRRCRVVAAGIGVAAPVSASLRRCRVVASVGVLHAVGTSAAVIVVAGTGVLSATEVGVGVTAGIGAVFD